MKLKHQKPLFQQILALKKIASENKINLTQLYIDILPPEYKRAELIPEVLNIIAEPQEEYTEEEVSNTILGFMQALDFSSRKKLVDTAFGLDSKDNRQVLQGAVKEVLKEELHSGEQKKD